MRAFFSEKNNFLLLLGGMVIVSATLVYLFTAGNEVLQQPGNDATSAPKALYTPLAQLRASAPPEDCISQHRYFQKGIVFPQWGATAYSENDTKWLTELPDIPTQTAACWVEMPILFYQPSQTSTTVTQGPSTPSLSSFNYGLHLARALGLHIFVTPLLQVGGSQPWSGLIHFSTREQEQQWFESYWQTLIFNVRYAVQMVAPAALFLAILANRCSKVPLLRCWSACYMVLILAIGLQALLTISTGIISLQDGQYGLSCAPQHQINVYLAQHYDEGRILEDTVATNTSFEDAGIDFRNVIYEGSGQLWEKALSNPSSVVDWVVIQQGDIVSQHINLQSPAFLARFAFVMQESTGMRLYHRQGAAPLPTRPMPDGLLTEHQLCSGGA